MTDDRFGRWPFGRQAWLVVANTLAASRLLPHPARAAVYRWCGIGVGRGTCIFPGQVVRPGRISFGAECFVNTGGYFDAGTSSIVVEDGVFIGPSVIVAGHSHEIGASVRRAGPGVSAPVFIGRGCWLGARVTVLQGVRIAPGCVVAAGSVVHRDTEPDGVYAGVPARRVRDLSPGDLQPQ